MKHRQSYTHVRETANPDVGFRVDEDGRWYIVDRVTGADVGPPYATRGDALAAIAAMDMPYTPHIVPREHRSTVARRGRTKQVKNLGWLLKHWRDVDHFETEMLPSGEVLMVAYLRDGGTYQTNWASPNVMRQWLHRPVFRGIRVVWMGEETIA